MILKITQKIIYEIDGTINFGFNKNALNIINFRLIKVFFLIILVIMPALFFVQTAYYYDSFEFIFDFLALKKTLINTRFGNFWLLKLFLVNTR